MSVSSEKASAWQDVEKKGQAHLWKRQVDGVDNYVVTDTHSNNFPELGPEMGYPSPETAWAAYSTRVGIAREIDLNEM
jgi:hypothetical protein